MSVDVTFGKSIKIKDLHTKLNLNFTYYPETKLWVAERENGDCIQVIPDSDTNPTGVFLKDQDIDVRWFCIRSSTPGGFEIIRDIACEFQAMFLDDDGETEFFMSQADGSDEDLSLENLRKTYDRIFIDMMVPFWNLKYENGKIEKA